MRLALALLSTVTVSACALPRFDVTPRAGQLDVSGSFGASDSGPVSGKNDLKDMGLQKDTFVPGLRADVKFGVPHVVVNLQQSTSEGDGFLENPISNDGTTIPGGTAINSKLDLGIYNALFLFDLLAMSQMFDLELGLGATVLDADMRIAETSGALSVSGSQSIPFPVLAANAGVTFGPFEVAGLVNGVYYESGDDKIQYLDGDFFGRWAFIGADGGLRTSVALGYRVIDTDIQYNDGGSVEFDARFDGPYLGVEFSF